MTAPAPVALLAVNFPLQIVNPRITVPSAFVYLGELELLYT